MAPHTRAAQVCKSHARHSSFEAAQKEMCRLFEEKGVRVVVFPASRNKPCKCGGWHTGHLREQIKKDESGRL